MQNIYDVLMVFFRPFWSLTVIVNIKCHCMEKSCVNILLNFSFIPEKKVSQTGWNDTSLSEWWQKFHFGVNYPCNVTLENFSLLSVWDFSPSGKSSQKKKKSRWPDLKITWNCLDMCCFLSCNRGLLLERSGAGPLWHNYSRSIWSKLHKRRHPFRAWRLGERCSRTMVQCWDLMRRWSNTFPSFWKSLDLHVLQEVRYIFSVCLFVQLYQCHSLSKCTNLDKYSDIIRDVL